MRTTLLIATVLLLAGCMENGQSASPWAGAVRDALGAYGGSRSESGLSDATIAAGLKEALEVGTANVVTRLGRTDGFNLDPQIRIPLPSQLQKVDAALKIAGMNGLTQDLETRMNRAAERATPRAKQLFVNAITQMSFADARQILFGSQQDAATQFFRRTMGKELVADIQPIVQATLTEAGAIKAFDAATAQYHRLPLVGQLTGDAKSDLNRYVADKAVDGIFYYVAKEEAAIRADPAKRTTELLRQVFGAR